MSHLHRPTVTAAVAAILLAACGTGGDADPSPTPPSPTAVSGTEAVPTATDEPPAEPTPTDEPAALGTVISLTVEGGEVTGAEDRVTVAVGEEVTLRVTADADDEIHVHGYDLHHDVVAGEEASLTFTADIPGVFEVEFEDSGVLLVKLEVR